MNGFRFERKFVSTYSNLGRVNASIKHNQALFRQSFPSRQVNNIYFDTPGADCYFDNLFGIGKRWKARIRWYGDLFQDIAQPVLEIKMKQGHLGTKKSWVLDPIVLNGDSNNTRRIKNVLNKSDIPADVKNKLLGMQPVLVNNYQRSYYISANSWFRLTLDSQLEYRDFRFFKKHGKQIFRENGKLVLELKYAKEHDLLAGSITNSFPFRLNKNSKFVSGMGFIRPGIPD